MEEQGYILENNNHNSYKRYASNDNPQLEDVRVGFARITTKGKIKWIKVKKLNKLLKRMCFSYIMTAPIIRTMNYSGLCRQIIQVNFLD